MTSDNTTEEKQSGKQDKIKISLLLPLTLVILALLGAAIISIYRLQQQHINNQTQMRIDKTQYMFQMELDEDAELLNGLIDFLEHDENIQNAWLVKDRDALLQCTLPVFNDICSKYRVTHFYFIDMDRVCFLRVHNPPRHGDYIDRFTMDHAVHQKKPTHGIELGPYGTFTLRVVRPWKISGELVGYIELGQEIKHIIPELRKVTGSEIFFVIEKSYLNRAKWEEGMRMIGHDRDWDQFEQFVVISSTKEEIPPTLDEITERNHAKHGKFFFDLSIGGRHFHNGFVPLFDAGGREVGEIIVMNDVTEKEASLRTSAAVLTTICAVIGGLLFTFFYFFIGRIERRIIKGRNDLIDGIDERKTVEKALDNVNKCFLNFGPDSHKNINKIIETAGVVLRGTCALYNKEEGALLCTRGGWNIPDNLKREDNKEGHICYDVITRYKDEPFIVNNLDKTSYTKTDPNVTKYKLKTYIGCAVKIHGKAIGSLCVVYQKNRTFNSNELKIFSILVEALGIEEERKKAEEVLQKSEEQFRISVGTLLDGFSIFSAIKDNAGQIVDFRYEYINESGCQLNRRTYEEQVGHTLLELLPAHKDTGLLDEYAQLVETGKPLVRESLVYEDIFGGGQRRLNRAFDFQAVKLGDGFAVAWRDVTEHKKAEDKVENLAKFPSENPNPVLRIASNGTVLYSNMASSSLLEDWGCEINKCVPGKSLPDRWSQLVADTLESGSRKNIEIEHRGRIFLFEVVPVVDANYVNLYGSDITERKRAEEVLRESEEKYKTLTESSLTGVFIQQDGRYVFVNKRFAQIHDYKPEELLGKEYLSLTHPDERDTVAQIVSKRLAAEPVTQRYEMRRLKKNGQAIWCEVMVTRVDYNGKPAIMGNIIDTTERKRDEELLEKLNEDLESTVQELTRSNQQLQEFTYVTAHDLKTPLRSIGTLADWISTDYGDKLDEKGREQVKLLVEKTKRMDNLIDSILHYSNAGVTIQKDQQVDLNKLLSEAISEIGPPENVEITIESELPTVICEQARMMQVFENLLSNAVKYIDKPKGQIRVGCVAEDAFWKFSIADNGPGIEERYFEKIFGIFQTLSRRDEVASTGIGLSIVKRIVNVYGGRVWVESKVGKGSTFFFTLPKQMEAKNTKRKADTAREK